MRRTARVWAWPKENGETPGFTRHVLSYRAGTRDGERWPRSGAAVLACVARSAARGFDCDGGGATGGGSRRVDGHVGAAAIFHSGVASRAGPEVRAPAAAIRAPA